MKELNFDKSFQKAYDFLDQTKKNLFITGKAGVGKSTLLSYFISKTKKNTVLLAPTGVAALNIKGSTIHSFFKFKPGITIEKARRKAKTLKTGEQIYQLK